MSLQPRNTTIRDRHRAAIRRTKADCGLCGGPIDYTLPASDPMSFVVDHVIPLHRGGTDTRDNTQAAHRVCNRAKGSKLPAELQPEPTTFVTWRDWTGGGRTPRA